jgi:hypothetical protein
MIARRVLLLGDIEDVPTTAALEEVVRPRQHFAL